jgi:hypothetical protein
MNYFKETEKLLQKLPHKLQVLYAYNCAISVKDKLNPNDTASLECLNLIALWLKDSSLVDSQTLSDTAYHVVTVAFGTASYASAAYYAATAASAAANAAAAAATATAYAMTAAYADSKDKYSKHYYEMLISMINDITKVERLIWKIEEEK